MSDIRKRLGLDYLKEGQSRSINQRPLSESEKTRDPYLEDARLAFGMTAMKAIAKSPDRTTTVFHLVDELQEPVSVLGPVLESLRNDGYLDFIDEDPKGDHTVRLTDRGENLVG